MGYYFKMYKNDLKNFYLPMANSDKYSLSTGFMEVAFGPVIKSFSCKIIEEYESTINENESVVIIEIEQNIDKETNNRTTILVPRNYPIGDKIKVHLVNYIDEVYIDSDYNDYRKNKVRYYFALTKKQQDKFIKNSNNGESIIMMDWNSSDRSLFKIKNVSDDNLRIHKIYSILIDPEQFHTGKDLSNGYQKQVYKSFIDEEFDTIKFFTSIYSLHEYLYSIMKKDIKNYTLADTTNTSKKETKMTKIKDIKLNGPATILFTTDNKKVVVKCRPGDDYDPEKGILMALCKYIINSNTNRNNWTEVFDIPYKDEIDVEKVIAMTIVKGYFCKNDKDWHYNCVLKYMYNAVNLKTEDRVKALKALDYSVERIARCLGVTKWFVKNALDKAKTVKTTTNKPKITVTGTKGSYIENLLKEKPELKNNASPYEVPDHKPCNMEELPTKQKDIISDQDIIDLFNKGYSISKISKELGLTEYFVKKYLDAYTNPKTEKKAGRILRKALKSAQKEKKDNKPIKHVRRTQIDYPDYLDKETCDMVLERTKEKYKDHDKIQYLSELQKYFIMECKREYIVTHYGNGYDMYTIAKVLGINAPSVQRIWNAYKSGKEK